MEVSELDIREGIASELADILYRQQAIVRCNESLNLLSDSSVIDQFRTMAEEDEKNLRMMNTVVTNFGIRIEPKFAAIRLTDAIVEIIEDTSALPLEKLGVYALIKQNQMLCSHLVHKSAQLAQPDIKMAIGPFEGVYATFSKQVAELTVYTERFGVEWITGQQPKTGLIGRARDAIATAAGAILSKTAKPADEMKVMDVLTMQHRKVDLLFGEIQGTKDHAKSVEIFQQLKADLTTHSIAEEETVYSRFIDLQDMKERMVDARDEHADMRLLLDEITELSADREAFYEKVEELKELVHDHVTEEEGEIFDLIKKHSTSAEQIRLSQAFITLQQKLQENVGMDQIVSSANDDDVVPTHMI